MKLKLIRNKIIGQLEETIKSSTVYKFFVGSNKERAKSNPSSKNETEYELGEVKVLEIRDHTNGTIRRVFIDNSPVNQFCIQDYKLVEHYFSNKVDFEEDDDLSTYLASASFQGIFEDETVKYTCRDMGIAVHSDECHVLRESVDLLQTLRIGSEYYIIKEFQVIKPKKDGFLDIQKERKCYYYPDFNADPKNYVVLDLSIKERALKQSVNAPATSYNLDELKELENDSNSNNEIQYSSDDIYVISITDNTSNTTKYFFMIGEERTTGRFKPDYKFGFMVDGKYDTTHYVYDYKFEEAHKSLFSEEELMDIKPFKSGIPKSHLQKGTYVEYRGIFEDRPCSCENRLFRLAGSIPGEVYEEYGECFKEENLVVILRCGSEAYMTTTHDVMTWEWNDLGNKHISHCFPNYQGKDNPGEYYEVDVKIYKAPLMLLVGPNKNYTLSELKEMEDRLNKYGYLEDKLYPIGIPYCDKQLRLYQKN